MSIANIPEPSGNRHGRASSNPVARRPLTGLPTLAGAAVHLREVSLEDVDAITTLLADPRVTEHQLRRPPEGRDAVAEWIRLMHRRRAEGAVLCFAVTLRDAHDLIGLGQLSVPDGASDVEWGWLLKRTAWGSGVFADLAAVLCGFAKAHFGVSEVTARVHVANGRAAGALRKIGSELRSTADSTMVWTTATAAECHSGNTRYAPFSREGPQSSSHLDE
jgi:RimJ/RimL family protein N-acetyltransferase